ncbi:MAG TPA: hypothetical protein PK772_06310 [Chitinophagaceae bacterium]|nr:hypothetical protein [Chitinophagaceae bacterium]
MDITNIDQLLADIALAEKLIDEAKDYYYRVKKKLESIYSPASPIKGKPSLSYEQRAEIRANRLKTINRKLVKNNQSMINTY